VTHLPLSLTLQCAHLPLSLTLTQQSDLFPTLLSLNKAPPLPLSLTFTQQCNLLATYYHSTRWLICCILSKRMWFDFFVTFSLLCQCWFDLFATLSQSTIQLILSQNMITMIFVSVHFLWSTIVSAFYSHVAVT